MYQLSHLITEQKSLLTSLLELSITGKCPVPLTPAEPEHTLSAGTYIIKCLCLFGGSYDMLCMLDVQISLFHWF